MGSTIDSMNNGGGGGTGALGLLWVATSIQKKLKLALVYKSGLYYAQSTPYVHKSVEKNT